MSGISYQGFEIQKHQAKMRLRMWGQVGLICLALQVVVWLVLVQLRVSFVFDMVPAPYRELVWKWPLARLAQVISPDETFLLHTEQLPHWWSGTMAYVAEARARDLVRTFPYSYVFTAKDAHWGWAVSLSFLAWPLCYLSRRIRKKLALRLRMRRLLKGRLSFLADTVDTLLNSRSWVWMCGHCNTLRQKTIGSRPVGRGLHLCHRVAGAVREWTGTASLKDLLPFSQRGPDSVAGMLSRFLFVQLVLLLLLVQAQVRLEIELVPLPYREMIWKWPVAKLEQALFPNGKFRLHSEKSVLWWNGKRGRVLEVRAQELAALPYSSVFSAKDAHWGQAFLLSFLPWLLALAVLAQSRRATRRMHEDEHIRGAHVLSEEDIAATTGDGILAVSSICIPEALSRRHMLVAGQTGSGKSNLIAQHLAAIQSAKRRVLASDFKGEMVQGYYRQERDLILNPFDARGVGWTLFNDIDSKLDLAAIVGSLVPLGKGNELFWTSAAQDVARGAMGYCYLLGERTNAYLFHVLTSSTRQIAEMCRATEFGRAACRYLEDPSSKMAEGIMAVLTSNIAWLEYAPDGDFSLRRWAENSGDSSIFITSLKEASNIVRPYLSLFTDLAGMRFLALPEITDPADSIYLLLDELGNMQRLSSLKHILTAGRSKGLVVEIGIQEMAGMESVYGREDTRTIINNCGSKMIMNLGESEAAELFSALCGQEDFWQFSSTYSIDPGNNRVTENYSRQQKTRQVVTPTEIMRLPVGTGYFMLPGGNPARVEVPWVRGNRRLFANEAFILRSGLSLEGLRARDRHVTVVAQEIKQGPVPEDLKKKFEQNRLERQNGCTEAGGILGVDEGLQTDFTKELSGKD